MVRWFGICLLMLIAAVARAADEVAPKLDHDQILSVMHKAYDWQLAALPTEKLGGDDTNLGWIRAPFFVGALGLYRASHDEAVLAAMADIAQKNKFQPGKRPRHADDEAVGQLYADLYFIKNDPAMIAPMRERWDKIMAQPMDGRTDWWWCDALFMAPPAIARLGAATGDHKYFDFLNKQYWDTTDFLYDKSEHLFFRDKSYFATREANGKKIFWSRGNGWVIAGIARILQYLPKDDAGRPKFEALFKEMAEKIITLQQPDGFWRTSLLDPESCPGGESSGTGFYCFAFACGVNEGLLPREQYLPSITKAWAALSGAVAADGKLQWVQKPGAKPAKIVAEDTAEYGTGAFLLAGEQVLKLTEGVK
jgi:rhamnogalacturonyl hydrolase YesR